MSALNKFYIKPSEGEIIETTVKLTNEKTSIIKGLVKNESGTGAANACVLLYDTLGKSAVDEYELKEVTVTDADGHFILGPVEPSVFYAVYIYKNDVKTRELELRGKG